MASGETNVTICNQALNLLGADTISSFSDTSNDAAAVCNNIYETVKRQTLSMYQWSFAFTKLQLAQSSTAPIGEWTYRYDLPSTAVAAQPFQVYNTSSTGSSPIRSFEIFYTTSGPAIFTNETIELRSEVLWTGNMNLQYPEDLEQSTTARILADTTFTIKGWLYPYSSTLSGSNIFIANTYFAPITGFDYV